ncbi:unnamed protein product, partial [Effrenium voratum]
AKLRARELCHGGGDRGYRPGGWGSEAAGHDGGHRVLLQRGTGHGAGDDVPSTERGVSAFACSPLGGSEIRL